MSINEIRFRMLLEYLYGRGVANSVPWSELEYLESRKSSRLKQVIRNGTVFATIQENGMIALSIECATFLMKERIFRHSCVLVKNGFENEIKKGFSLFCKHVSKVGSNVAPGMDVAVVDKRWKLLATGKALLPREYMLSFKRGVAVRVRLGVEQKGVM